MSLSIGTLVGYLQLDDTKFTAIADRADKKIDGLKLHLEALSKTNPKIKVEADLKALDELKARMDFLRAESAKGVDVKVQTGMANIELDRLMLKVRSLHNAEIKVNVDDKAALTKLEALKKASDDLNKVPTGGLFGSALAFGPALLPMVNMLPGALFAVGSGAVASAAGVGVLALAFHGLGDAVSAYQKYEKALPFAQNAKQVAALKKTLDMSAYGSQNAAGRDFTRTIATKGSAAVGGIKSAAQAGVFPGADRALHDILPLVPTIEHLMKSLGTTVGDMTDKTAKALNSPFWRQWFHWLGEDAKTQLPLVGGIFGNFFKGLMQGIERFSPQGTSLLTWLDNLSLRFSKWTGSPQFDKFMATTAADATAVGHALQPLGKVLVDLFAGMSGTGMVELQVFGQVMSGIASLPTGVISLLGATLPLIFLSLKAISLTGSIAGGIGKIGDAFTKLATGEGLAVNAGRLALFGAGLAVVADSGDRTSKSMGILQGAVGGAMSGAGLGMFAGPEGAAIGGGIGAIAGGLFALAHNTTATGHAAQVATAYITNYTNTLKGLRGAATIDTRKAILDNVQKNQALFKSLGMNDKQIANAIAGRAHVYQDVLNKINSPVPDAKVAVLAAENQLALAKDNGYKVPVYQQKLADAQAAEKAAETLAARQIEVLNALRNQEAAYRKVNAEALTYAQLVGMGIPKPLAHLINKDGIAQDTAAVAKVIDQFHIVSRTKWSAVLTAAGIVPTAANLKRLQVQLQQLKHPVTIPVDADTSAAQAKFSSLLASMKGWAGNPTPAPHTGKGGHASGGTVAGARQPYGDKVPAMLAPGEEVISNSHGQADRHRAILKMINNGMSGGGTVDPLAGFGPSSVPGSSSSHHGKHHGHGQTRKQRLNAELTAANKALAQTKSMLSAAQQWSQSFGGNAFDPTNLAPFMTAQTSAPITSMVNGMKVTQSGGPVASTPQSTLLAMLAYQKSEKTQAKNLSGWVAKLRKEGISKGVTDQMQASGPQGIAEIQALASGTVAQVRAFNASNTSEMGYLNNTGALATSGQTYTALQQKQMQEQSAIHLANQLLKKPVNVRVVNGNLRP